MQLYVSDFIGDTLHLSTEQIGAYLMLLMAMWNAKGKLPDDDAKLARIVRLSVKKWRSISPELMAYFDHADGTVTHHRLTFELEKSERQSESRASAGSRGGTATALKYNKPRSANAPANQPAKPQHLPEPYRKNGANALVPTDGLVLSRTRADHEALWIACEEVMGEKVKDFLKSYAFPSEIIAKARETLEQRKTAA
jgi:uncharacterized protein YdaU (DUF1376 family)